MKDPFVLTGKDWVALFCKTRPPPVPARFTTVKATLQVAGGGGGAGGVRLVPHELRRADTISRVTMDKDIGTDFMFGSSSVPRPHFRVREIRAACLSPIGKQRTERSRGRLTHWSINAVVHKVQVFQNW